jgi:RES domain-containing protein
MILWRLTRRPHADLSGRGGRLADGRWHSRGQPIVYCATSAALAVLEVRVHLDLPLDLLPDDYVLMQIAAPDDLEVRTSALPICERAGNPAKTSAVRPATTGSLKARRPC